MEFLLIILSLGAILFILIKKDMDRMGVMYREESEDDGI